VLNEETSVLHFEGSFPIKKFDFETFASLSSKMG
jgi:hypothetical protein